jgi:hypothetical protein
MKKKEKVHIFDLLVNHYGVPGRVLNLRRHPNHSNVLTLRTDLNAADRG